MRRLILTAAFQGHERIATLTGKTVRAYADRIGADLKVMVGEEVCKLFPGPHWSKVAVGLALTGGGYDEVAWIDSDAIVSPSAPDIFELAGGRFAAFPESSRLDRLGNFTEYLRHTDEHWHEYKRPERYFNTGIMVVPKRYAHVMTMPADEVLITTRNLRRTHPDKFFHDQDWFNSQLLRHDVEVTELPVAFNFMPFDDIWQNRHNDAHIIYYAGWLAVHGNGLLEIIGNDMRRWGVYDSGCKKEDDQKEDSEGTGTANG